ncbi:Ankrd23 [Symbiodinium microadriaticum]|nr:Ankrd23 [Symbiodinium microadriaticum]
MSDWQHLSIRICLVTYVVHMGSLVCWFLAAVRGWCRSSKAGTAPSEYEYWVVRLFLIMAVADFARGVDGLSDTFEDGSFVSVWGSVNISGRFFAWWLRDLLGFQILLLFHSFTVRWSHTALELPMPRLLMTMVRFACATATIGFGTGLCGALVTNKQIWQVVCMVSVLPYNAVSCFMCGRHLWRILPQLANGSDPESGDLLARSRTTATRMLVAHAIMLSAFPALIHQKVMIGQNPLIAHLPVGTWIGSTLLPVITDVPVLYPGKHPSPALEIVEITMGWFCLSLWWPVVGCGSGADDGKFVVAETIGSRMRAAHRGKSD